MDSWPPVRIDDPLHLEIAQDWATDGTGWIPVDVQQQADMESADAWFAPRLVELVDHWPGMEITIGDKQLVRVGAEGRTHVRFAQVNLLSDPFPVAGDADIVSEDGARLPPVRGGPPVAERDCLAIWRST